MTRDEAQQRAATMLHDLHALDLRELRSALGWTYEALSIRTGINKSLLFDWHAGRSRPRFDNLLKLLKVYAAEAPPPARRLFRDGRRT